MGKKKKSLSLTGFTFADLTELLRGRRKRPREVVAGGPSILMAVTAYQAVMSELGRRQPEYAGVLLGPVGHRAVTHFVPDEGGQGTAVSFTFDSARLTRLVRRHAEFGLDCKGFAHSHPSGYRTLSGGDLEYVRRVLEAPGNDVTEVLMPIVADGTLYPFLVRRDQPDRALKADLILF